MKFRQRYVFTKAYQITFWVSEITYHLEFEKECVSLVHVVITSFCRNDGMLQLGSCGALGRQDRLEDGRIAHVAVALRS